MKALWRRKRSWPSIEMSEIRKRARLLVIDDNDFPYQKLFHRDGYAVDKWDDISDMSKLDSGHYDVILLDILGVGRDYSKEQGLGILRHLRKVCPAQIIIAYSTADFSLDKREFFDLADDSLAKGEDYVRFKEAVDRLLSRRFALGFYVDRIARLASPYIPNSAAVRAAAESAILKSDPSILEREMLKGGVSKEVVTMVLQVAQVAIGIASLVRP